MLIFLWRFAKAFVSQKLEGNQGGDSHTQEASTAVCTPMGVWLLWPPGLPSPGGRLHIHTPFLLCMKRTGMGVMRKGIAEEKDIPVT